MDLFVYYSIFSHPPRIRRPQFLRFFFNMACRREEFWWSSSRGWVPGQELQNSIFPDDDNIDDNIVSDAPVIACVWIIEMSVVIAILSYYVVSTIEAASESWNLSVSFISIILLPIVGNAAEHAGALIFAFKNKIDITLGVSLGSSTQISMFLVPLTTLVAWIKDVHMDLDFKLIETISLVMAILMTTITLQGHHWHYMKGSVLFLCFIAIGTLFFLQKPPLNHATATDIDAKRNQ